MKVIEVTNPPDYNITVIKRLNRTGLSLYLIKAIKIRMNERSH
jgi:hypothetical protein